VVDKIQSICVGTEIDWDAKLLFERGFGLEVVQERKLKDEARSVKRARSSSTFYVVSIFL
jgi:hypothetical protein